MARTRMARLPWMIRTLFSLPKNLSNSSRKQIFREIFSILYTVIVCCVYSLESPHRGDSNEYTQHTNTVYKIEKISLNYRYLLPDLGPCLTLSGSNYPCLERISMVLKMFEPLMFDCICFLKYLFLHYRVKLVRTLIVRALAKQPVIYITLNKV